ncbi:cilia- and flagella-associated protein 251-like [Oncorhynchus nerka]|uniref:cilia- and flagella-associated protein 251-like n=1 Tax=Oncorhynchus nerka TaxID=8023 RepID=UPI0031B7F922
MSKPRDLQTQRRPSPVQFPSPGRERRDRGTGGVLIQPPPRSKWEREEEEEEEEQHSASRENGALAVSSSVPRDALRREVSPAPPSGQGREVQGSVSKTANTEGRRGREEGTRRREEGRGLKKGQVNFRKPAKTESRGVKEEGRGGVGREESRGAGPEPRRQRLCSDLGRETDEAAFVPDYSEGEGSDGSGAVA